MELQIVLLLVNIIVVMGEGPIIDTKYGKVQGKVDELNGNKYTGFYGIPFAAPPVGKLRFKDPEAPEAWGDSVLDAQKFGPACPQLPGMEYPMPLFPKRLGLSANSESEDCLTLNIYTPGDIAERQDSLPVLVFIHGGGFIIGGAPFQQGETVVTMVDDPIVMVTIQYRMNVLGFLASGDDTLPGNLGLKDQTFALKWIQENIAAFGGDPNRVTIAGESAGGESILAHMISPMSAGLFQKAIGQSPPPAWIYPENEIRAKYFDRFVDAMDCDADTSEQEIECLRGKSWEELVNVTDPAYHLTCIRVIDGEFITDEPRKLWAEGKYNDADLMFGLTSDDGKMFVDFNFSNFTTNRSKDLDIIDMMPGILYPTMLSDDFDWFKPDIIAYKGQHLANYDDLKVLMKSICYHTGTAPLGKARKTLDCARDVFFLIFGYNAIMEMAKRNDNVHMYIFDHRSDEYPGSGEGGMWLGGEHGSEIAFQFGYGFTDPEEAPMTAEELTLSRSMMHAWASYAAGEPSFLDVDGEEIAWPSFTLDDQNVLTFDTAMSAESISDASHTWTPVLDLWKAVMNLADFQDPEEEAADNGGEQKDEL